MAFFYWYPTPIWCFRRRKFSIFLFGFILANTLIGQAYLPAHGHNDYTRKKPLILALNNGIRSIEVDLFQKNDQLIVSHIPVGLKIKPTFEELYLEPLGEIIQKNGGTVFPNDSTPLILYLDFKTSDGTLEKVKQTLQPYWPLLYLRSDTGDRWGPIQILVDHHEQKLMHDQPQWAQIQKGCGDFAIDLPPEICPRLSGHYGSIFKWRGRGEIPEDELQKMKAIVDSAHAYDRTVRLYAIPPKRVVWDALLSAGMDWINIDNYHAFKLYWEEKWKQPSSPKKQNE